MFIVEWLHFRSAHFALLDEVGNLFEQSGYIVVLDHDSERKIERLGGEIQNALDACVDNRQNDLLDYARRTRQNYDIDIHIGHRRFEIVHRDAGDVVDCFAHLVGVDVERGDYFEFETLAVEILGYRLSKVAHTDDGYVHRLCGVENFAYEIDEHADVVALFGVARKTYEHKVAAHLNGRYAMHSGQHVRKNMGYTLFLATQEGAAIFA